MKPSIDRMLVGEALVGEGNEVAHIDLLIGPRGSPVETVFASTLTSNKEGFLSLLAVIEPNLMTRPATVMYNKVRIRGAQQAEHLFGPAQQAVATAVADSVADGTIDPAQADELFICVGVFIHWLAEDDTRIHDFNYEAVRLAIRRAVDGEPSSAELLLRRPPAGAQ